MPLEDVNMCGIERQHTFCSLVYHGVFDCEGEHMCRGIVCKNRFS